MGRGLAAILAVTDEPATEDGDLRHVPLDLIAPNPRQPRRSFDQASLQALADSVRERGIVQPVLVRPVAGGTLRARRRRAPLARSADRRAWSPCPRSSAPRDDSAALEIALIENMAREDLNPVEEARACAALVEELGLTREDVGRRVGRSRVAVSNLLRLLDLPDETLGLLEAGELTEGHGRALLLAEDHGDRRTLGARGRARGLDGARDRGASAREANAPGAIRGAARKARRASRPGARPRPRSPRRSGAPLGVEVRVRADAAAATARSSTFDDAEQAHELAARLARARG